MTTVTIGGLTFEEAPRDVTRAFVIEPHGLTGWFEGVEVRRDESSRPTARGSFDEPGYSAARVPAIRGTILAGSPVELDLMRAQLTGLLADGGTGRVVVAGVSGTTWADVRLAAKPSVDESTDAIEADYQIQFWAADPCRYGGTNTVSSATGANAFHYGNVAAIPVIEVTAVASMPSGYTVSAGGKSFVVAQALTAGQTHRIDMETGWVYRDGALQTGAVGAAELWTVPPGQRLLHTLTPVSGSGLMTVTTIDTYI